MFEIDRKQVDSITFGDTKYRLMESEKGTRVIELYSSLSKKWNVSVRYNVDEQWNKMKTLYEGMKRRNE
jgi:hypothetical protein